MRIISSQVASLIASSQLLSSSGKILAMERDIELAKFFESASARAIYCLGKSGTLLQFLGVHERQKEAVSAHINSSKEQLEIFGISMDSAERLTPTQALNFSSVRSHKMNAGTVHDKDGRCIAMNMKSQVTPSGMQFSFDAGCSFRNSPSDAAALRLIVLEEARLLSGLSTQVCSLFLGLKDLTVPSTYRGWMSRIGQGHPDCADHRKQGFDA